MSFFNNQAEHSNEGIKNITLYNFIDNISSINVVKPAKSTYSLSTIKLSGHSLFVGGSYYLQDGNADVRNIGMYDLREKKWYDLAGGVCGPVYDITEMNGSIYVGGEFTTAGRK